jgi:transcription elongation factor Elf1
MISARKKKHGLTLADCVFASRPECAHCGRKLPDSTPMERQGDCVVATCGKCGCWTPFKIVES